MAAKIGEFQQSTGENRPPTREYVFINAFISPVDWQKLIFS